MGENPLRNASAARRGGRPCEAEAGKIRGRILDIAAEMFLAYGYGACSIEAIAKCAGIAKRTFYHRFPGKSDLFRAVVTHLTTRLRPEQLEPLFKGGRIDDILRRLAKVILYAAVTPESVALHRLLVSEVTRFPELAVIMDTEGARQEAIERISSLLQTKLNVSNPGLAADIFLQMVISLPQRRAMGFGKPMSESELESWAKDIVQLFLHGCGKEVKASRSGRRAEDEKKQRTRSEH